MWNLVFHSDIWRYQIRDALIYWIYIPAGVIISGKIIDETFNLERLPGGAALKIIALLLLAAGLIIIWKSMLDLSRFGNGTPNPRRPSRILVTRGMYSVCRHPMFLGYDLAALGIVLLFRSPGMIFISYPVFIFLEIRFLIREERILRRRFRERFAEYSERVDFLVPLIRLWRNKL
jgi:protein-S-isoprenylcysteine O-methyltransferase Ste14